MPANTPSVPLSRPALVVSWILQAIVALIFVQTLFFKFTGAQEARLLFEALGAEPWGRWGVGLAELGAAILLLVPRTVPAGAALAIGLMLGAIFSHMARLGIVFNDDGGTLFAMAVVSLTASVVVLAIRRRQAISMLARV